MADISPQALSHYVGNWMLKARMNLGEGDVEQADVLRQDLLTKLKGLNADPAVDSCVKYLEKTSWKTPADVEAFQNHYEQVSPTARELEEVLRRLQEK